MKKIIALVVILTLVSASSAFAISKNEPFKKISIGMKNILCGTIEVPDNVRGTDPKDEVPFENCTEDTKSGIGRGIVRVVGGLWQLATFWYPTE